MRIGLTATRPQIQAPPVWGKAEPYPASKAEVIEGRTTPMSSATHPIGTLQSSLKADQPDPISA